MSPKQLQEHYYEDMFKLYLAHHKADDFEFNAYVGELSEQLELSSLQVMELIKLFANDLIRDLAEQKAK